MVLYYKNIFDYQNTSIDTYPPLPQGSGVSGNGLTDTGVPGRQRTGEFVPDASRESDSA
jgi:hypothetical protein